MSNNRWLVLFGATLSLVPATTFGGNNEQAQGTSPWDWVERELAAARTQMHELQDRIDTMREEFFDHGRSVFDENEQGPTIECKTPHSDVVMTIEITFSPESTLEEIIITMNSVVAEFVQNISSGKGETDNAHATRTVRLRYPLPEPVNPETATAEYDQESGELKITVQKLNIPLSKKLTVHHK